MPRPAAAPSRRCLRLAILVCALLAHVGASPRDARAQGMAGHPIPQGPRPLHQLVALADAVAIGTIDATEEGRVRVRDAVAVAGSPDASFELKRAPSSPPSFPVGARALLLLRGARSPYVLVDGPREQISFVDPVAEARWREALGALYAARAEPIRLRDLYLAWCDGDADDLREIGLRGLYDPDAGFHPIPDEIALTRARVALDPSRPPAVRKAAAAVALLVPAATASLVGGVPSAGPADEPGRAEVYEIALQGALLRQDLPGLVAAVRRGLASADTAVRRLAARYGAQVALPELRAAVARLAASDPDPEVRKIAGQLASGF